MAKLKVKTGAKGVSSSSPADNRRLKTVSPPKRSRHCATNDTNRSVTPTDDLLSDERPECVKTAKTLSSASVSVSTKTGAKDRKRSLKSRKTATKTSRTSADECADTGVDAVVAHESHQRDHSVNGEAEDNMCPYLAFVQKSDETLVTVKKTSKRGRKPKRNALSGSGCGVRMTAAAVLEAPVDNRPKISKSIFAKTMSPMKVSPKAPQQSVDDVCVSDCDTPMEPLNTEAVASKPSIDNELTTPTMASPKILVSPNSVNALSQKLLNTVSPPKIVMSANGVNTVSPKTPLQSVDNVCVSVSDTPIEPSTAALSSEPSIDNQSNTPEMASPKILVSPNSVNALSQKFLKTVSPLAVLIPKTVSPKTVSPKAVSQRDVDSVGATADDTTVRRSKRVRKVTELFNTCNDVVKGGGRPEKAIPVDNRKNRSKQKAILDTNTVAEEMADNSATPAGDDHSSEGKSTKTKSKKKSKCGKRGRSGIGELLSSYRRNVPEHQKRLKYVETDPSIDILHKKIGLVTKRLSAIPESPEYHLIGKCF